MGEVILKAKNIFKSYENGEKTLSVLNDLSIQAEKNQIITITGQSGSGKSTLLNILGSLDKPDFGEVEIDGQNISDLNNHQISKIRNQKIGFVFQFHHLLSEFTALENVLMPAWIGNSSLEKKDEAVNLFSELNLSSKMDCYPNQLSGGERSRVSLLRGIINKPKILLADEPTGNLDEKNAVVLTKLLKKINKDFNQSIIITTHNPDVAKLGCRRFNLANGVLKTMR